MKTELEALSSECIRKRLSTVINLIDDFSRDRPNGRVEITLEGCKTKPVKNPGGFYVFTGLFPGTYKLRIESDNYLSYREDLIIPESMYIKPPVLHIRLIPSVHYPFSWGSTLLRGTVYDKNGLAVSGVRIKANILLKGRNGNPAAIDVRETLSNAKGEFVVYFPNIGESTWKVKLEISFSHRKFIILVDGKEQDSLGIRDGSTTFVRVIEK